MSMQKVIFSFQTTKRIRSESCERSNAEALMLLDEADEVHSLFCEADIPCTFQKRK